MINNIFIGNHFSQHFDGIKITLNILKQLLFYMQNFKNNPPTVNSQLSSTSEAKVFK